MPPGNNHANWKNKTIWTGDNLYIMRGMSSDSVDLIYLNPPFNSKANYAAPIGSKAAGAVFKDTWTLNDLDAEWLDLIEARHPQLHRVIMAAMTNSDKAYLVYMAARLLEMHRILKPALDLPTLRRHHEPLPENSDGCRVRTQELPERICMVLFWWWCLEKAVGTKA